MAPTSSRVGAIGACGGGSVVRAHGPTRTSSVERWRQRWAGFNDPVSGTGLYRYTSMVDPNSTWAMQFNNGDAAPHLVMVPPTVSFYQNLYQDYVGP